MPLDTTSAQPKLSFQRMFDGYTLVETPQPRPACGSSRRQFEHPAVAVGWRRAASVGDVDVARVGGLASSHGSAERALADAGVEEQAQQVSDGRRTVTNEQLA